MSVLRILSTQPAASVWTDRLGEEDWRGWKRLSRSLQEGGRWKPDQVRSLGAESLRVVRHLRDPLINAPFSGRGLVVGYVQSGKTANYTAVSARAVDTGYRLIIVLSGIHDALRNQTQARLESELVGIAPGGDAAVAGWTLLTSTEADFQGGDPGVLSRPGAFLVVIKKNVHVLRRLNEFLAEAAPWTEGLAALVIDDEADQASINTRGNRSAGPSLDEGAEPDDSASAPSKTNGLVRTMLGLLPRVSYIAYTATPFANIFIDPQAMDREVGEDLFPRDFALQLPRPAGYTGTEELFGVSAQGRDVLRLVPDDDVGALKSTRAGRSAGLTVGPARALIPESLSDAFLTFCLAGAIRDARGLKGQPHTMLVHVSSLTQDQGRIAAALREQQDFWREAIRQGHGLDDALGQTLDRHLAGVELPAERGEVIAAARDVLSDVEIIELNSVAGEDLDYGRRISRHLVAVGGNRLSRGLTLEGLTVSFFLRTTNMADTLLQMARWYGFRAGYEDLIRIWTTDGIAHWFTELALVEQSLRDSLRALARAGRRPDEMAIRLRAHSGLLLTARNKSGQSVESQESWSGEHPQTVILPLKEPRRLAENRQLTDRFVEGVGCFREAAGGWLARDIPPEVVCDYLRLYRTHDDVITFRGSEMADWIMERVSAGELGSWSVLLAASSRGAETTIGGLRTGLLTRSRTSSDSIGILIDPRHEGVDLPGGAEAFRRASGNYDAEAMRAARPLEQGLLIIYPLDPQSLGVAGTDAVIALALSLPRTSDGARNNIVNRGVADG